LSVGVLVFTSISLMSSKTNELKQDVVKQTADYYRSALEEVTDYTLSSVGNILVGQELWDPDPAAPLDRLGTMERLQLHGVFAPQRGDDAGPDGRWSVQGIQEAAHDFDLTDVDLKLSQADGLAALDRHRDHLRIGLSPVEADEFDAELGELALPARARLVVTKYAPGIGKTKGKRGLAHRRRHESGHLGRQIHAEREQTAGLPVHELEHLIVRVLARRALEHVQVLEGRGDDLLEAPAPENGEELRLDRSPLGGFCGREDSHALRDGGTGEHGRGHIATSAVQVSAISKQRSAVSFQRAANRDQRPMFEVHQTDR
jgi:hypothetical protein